jgi:hypothetical protein
MWALDGTSPFSYARAQSQLVALIALEFLFKLVNVGRPDTSWSAATSRLKAIPPSSWSP